MRRTLTLFSTLALVGALLLTGCPSSNTGGGGGGGGTGGGSGDGSGGGKGDGSGGGTGGGSAAAGDAPTFSLAWSEYPSWSVFGVAHVNGIIDGEQGKLGPVEKKWNVDIVLNQLDYDPCIQAYGSGTVDAVCITNMDILSPCLGRDSVAILPTSTSDGADACIVVGIDDVDQLKDVKVYGLAKTVSEYCFARNLQLLGQDDADYQFSNMDPAAAAQAMQTGQDGFKAIMVWNPFVLQTLKTVPESKVLFDSTKIPGEIIDMVVVGKDALGKPGGKDFACAVIDAYYELNKMLADPQHADETLVELGRKFSSLELEEMKVVVEQTKFYDTPEQGLEAMSTVLPENMDKVIEFCVSHDIVDKTPDVAFSGGGGDAAQAQLLFDSSYIEAVKAKQ